MNDYYYYCYEDFRMDVKGKVLLQLFNKSNIRNETKIFLELIFFLYWNSFICQRTSIRRQRSRDVEAEAEAGSG